MIKHKVRINDFLNINSKEMAYILGLIWADGHVKKTKNNRHNLSITLLKNDMNEVKNNFTKFGKWNKYNINVKNEKPCICLKLNVKEVVNFLIKNDYSSKNKSPCKIISKIPKRLKHYWWRGYFDGDGCIVSHKSAYNILNIASCFFQDWTFVKKLFKKLKIGKFSIRRIKYLNKLGKLHKSSYVIIQNINDIDKFCSYIYDGFNKDKIGFTRKYNRYLILNKKFKRIHNMIFFIKTNTSSIKNRKNRIDTMLNIIKKYPNKTCNKTFQNIFKLSAPTISEDLKFLLDNKLINTTGNTKSKIYF